MHYPFCKFALTLVAIALLGACGGGGGGGDDAPLSLPPADESAILPPTKVPEVIVDSAVQGLRWEAKELSGTTDAAGTYEYFDGYPVRFYIGDILLGESDGLTTIIAQDIVAGAQNIDNATVLNIARVILTLDDDADSSNGIDITQTVSALTAGETLKFAQSTAAFTADGNVQIVMATLTAATTAGARELVTPAFAREHLRLTISYLLAGDYTGTYSGDGSGSWSGTVNLNGDFSGTVIPATGSDPIPMAKIGAISGDGSGKAGFGASGGAIGERAIDFTGVFRTDGNASGVWIDQDKKDTGTWIGTKK